MKWEGEIFDAAAVVFTQLIITGATTNSKIRLEIRLETQLRNDCTRHLFQFPVLQIKKKEKMLYILFFIQVIFSAQAQQTNYAKQQKFPYGVVLDGI